MDGMKTKRLWHDSCSFCKYLGRKHLPVSSIVFSSVGKKSFTQPHRMKAIQASYYDIVLFETAEQNIAI